jgi:muramoyltetrapeptide carboxypeptidase LdcA involved in peptidoglycan recycling
MSERTIKSYSFIAPSTCLPRSAKGSLARTARLLSGAFGLKAGDVGYSASLFSSDEQIDHVTAPADERSREFKRVIRECDLVVSVAGGTGAEDLAFMIDRKDYRVIRERRPVFIGFSDFAFLLNEIYYRTHVPVVYFPSLKLGKSNSRKVIPLIRGEEIQYQGRRWLTPPPERRISGIPIGGNLSTFVNFLNRIDPPRFAWSRHILFVEDIQIDVEDLHRLLAALLRHNVLDKIRGLVVGSLYQYSVNHNYKKNQQQALKFVTTYLRDLLRARRRQGNPLPILAVTNFGHNITRDLMAVPIGGRATIFKSKKITFQMKA